MTATYDNTLTRFERFQQIAAARINVPDHVENDSAYIAHGAARITSNWVRGNRTRWFAAHSDAQRLSDWLMSAGEFAGEWDHYGNYKAHPLAIKGNNGFMGLLLKLAVDLDECGGLTDKQTEIVRKALANQERFASERKAKFAAQDAGSQHIGTVGERTTFELTLNWVKYFEGAFGATYIHGFKDAAGNVVIYKGSKCLGQKGDTVKVKATIKEHGERDGVKQTLISRPAQ